MVGAHHPGKVNVLAQASTTPSPQMFGLGLTSRRETMWLELQHPALTIQQVAIQDLAPSLPATELLLLLKQPDALSPKFKELSDP